MYIQCQELNILDIFILTDFTLLSNTTMPSHGDLPSELTLHVPVAYIYGRFYVGYHCASRLNAWASVGTVKLLSFFWLIYHRAYNGNSISRFSWVTSQVVCARFLTNVSQHVFSPQAWKWLTYPQFLKSLIIYVRTIIDRWIFYLYSPSYLKASWPNNWPLTLKLYWVL